MRRITSRISSRGLAAAIVRLRYVIVGAWVAIALAATILLPPVDEAQSDSLGDLVATDGEAIATEVRSHELFSFPLLSRTVVVQRDPNGLSAEAHARVAENAARLNAGALEGLESILFALSVANVLGEPPFSREDSTTALTYLFFPLEIGPSGRTGLAHRFAERHLAEPEDAYVGVTGAAAAREEQSEVIADSLPLVELATLAIVIAALLVHFRALGAPLVNLAAVAIAYLVAVRAVAAAGDALGLVVPAEVEPVIVALLFGIVTDYSIFFLARFRGRLAEGADEREAARRTTAELLPIIAVAGLTVAAASATLVIARLGFFQAFGPGLALSVLVALAVATTLVPAMLAIAGGRLFWPSGPRPEVTRRPPGRRLRDSFGDTRRRLQALPTKRPVLILVATTLPLLVLASGLLRLEVGNRTITSLPDGAEPKRAYGEASKGFAPGVLSPTLLLVEGDGITRKRGALREVQRRIEARAGIAEVVGPGQARQPAELGAIYSATGDAARYFVVLRADPFGSRGIRVVQALEQDLPALLGSSGLPRARASLAGDTALSAETVRKTGEDLVRVVPAATLVVFAILAMFLRALVAPLYLVVASLLALAASLGLTVFVFQDVLDRGGLAFYVPFTATVLLVALGSDYNVYLVGRIWNEARRRPLRQAVAVAGTRAAGAITAAGLVLAASFAMLALVPLSAFHELAFAVSAGLLIDAFIVRSLLTPALITLVGERSSWPGRRLAERVRERWPASRGEGGA